MRDAAAQEPPPLPQTAVEPQGLVPEPLALERGVIFMDRHFAGGESGNGFYVDFGNMIPGSGWISVGPGYRRWFADDRALVDTSAAVSWRGYKTAQARAELPALLRGRVTLGTQYLWQDFSQVDYFGEGPGTQKPDRGEYHLRTHDLVGYATFRPERWLSVAGSVGWLTPHIVESAFGAAEQPSYLHSDVSITADTRDFVGHPTRGSVLRAAVSNFADRDAGTFSFKRYEAEAAHFVPLADARVVLALRGWLVASDTGDDASVPFYLQPSLGGNNTLRGYDDYRFHDRHMLVLNVESRVALMTHVDAVAFVDAGNVAGRVADLDLAKRSYGAGLRVHSRRDTFARIDVARSNEGWRFIVKLTDPLQLSRLVRRTAPAPFVP